MDKTSGEVAVNMDSEEVTKPLVDDIVGDDKAMPEQNTACYKVVFGVFQSLAFICSVTSLVLGVFAIEAPLMAIYGYLMDATKVPGLGEISLGAFSLALGLNCTLLGCLGVIGTSRRKAALLWMAAFGYWCLALCWLLAWHFLRWVEPSLETRAATTDEREQQGQTANGTVTGMGGPCGRSAVVIPYRVGWILDDVVYLMLTAAILVHVNMFLMVRCKHTKNKEQKVPNRTEKKWAADPARH